VHSFNRICMVAPLYQMTLCRELCKNGWTDRFCGPMEAQVQSYSPGGANVLT